MARFFSITSLALFGIVFVVSTARQASATMSSQFNLNPYDRDVSSCWLTCNFQVTYALPLPGNRPNSESFIDVNCRWDKYLNLMALCLPVRCDSVNDVAFAVEFGEAFCKKADVTARVHLDENYTSSVGGYFATDDYKQWNSKFFERSSACARWDLAGLLVLAAAINAIVISTW